MQTPFGWPLLVKIRLNLFTVWSLCRKTIVEISNHQWSLWANVSSMLKQHGSRMKIFRHEMLWEYLPMKLSGRSIWRGVSNEILISTWWNRENWTTRAPNLFDETSRSIIQRGVSAETDREKGGVSAGFCVAWRAECVQEKDKLWSEKGAILKPISRLKFSRTGWNKSKRKNRTSKSTYCRHNLGW